MRLPRHVPTDREKYCVAILVRTAQHQFNNVARRATKNVGLRDFRREIDFSWSDQVVSNEKVSSEFAELFEVDSPGPAPAALRLNRERQRNPPPLGPTEKWPFQPLKVSFPRRSKRGPRRCLQELADPVGFPFCRRHQVLNLLKNQLLCSFGRLQKNCIEQLALDETVPGSARIVTSTRLTWFRSCST